MRRCVRCIMPETASGISFDEHGVCTLCRGWVEPELAGEDALRTLVSLARGTAQPHDSVVPLSGGRDSTYVLYLAKRELGLSPLAVNFDNEFRNPQAVENMERACSILGVELLVVRLKRNLAAKRVRSRIRATIRHGLPAAPDSMCLACSMGYTSAVRREAEQRHIPLVLWGNSKVEMKGPWGTPMPDKNATSTLERMLNPNTYLTEYYALLERIELHVRGNPIVSRSTQLLRDPSVQEVSVFDYIPWQREVIKSTISSELGWQKPEGSVSTWRTDCSIHELVNFAFVARVGHTADCVGYCKMINAGQMTRSVALAQEETAAANCGKRAATILTDNVGLTPNEANRIVEHEMTHSRRSAV
jgi:hypothetical protein